MSSSSSRSPTAAPAKRPAGEEGSVSVVGWAHSSVELAAGRTSLCTASLFQARAHSSSNRQPVLRLPKEQTDHVATNKRSLRKTFLPPITLSQSSASGYHPQFLHKLSGSHSRALIGHICFLVRMWTETGSCQKLRFYPCWDLFFIWAKFLIIYETACLLTQHEIFNKKKKAVKAREPGVCVLLRMLRPIGIIVVKLETWEMLKTFPKLNIFRKV